MTKLLEKALEAVRRLPPDSQDEIALAMLTLSGRSGRAGGDHLGIPPAAPQAFLPAMYRHSQPTPRLKPAFRRFEQ